MPATGDKTISINIRAITGELTSGLKTATGATKQWAAETQGSIAAVEASTERISRLWRSAFEAFLGFEAVNMLKKLALGAAEAADQLTVASRVAQNFGHGFSTTGMETWLEAFARSAKGGGYAIDEMRASVQQFASVGLDAAQIQRAIADSASLAAAKNMDFAEAATIVRYALTGHVEMLTRYGIITREAAKNIKTVEQAMDALEHASSGAAEERAQTLIGAFGRLATAAQLLGQSFGTALEPFFDAVATAMTGLANALDAIPAPVMRVIGMVTAFAVSLAAVTLVLPAIAKGIAIMGEGLRLVIALLDPAIIFVARLASTLGLATTGFEAFTAAELASVAPIAAIVIAIAGITVALVEMVNHMDHVKTAWHDWTQYLSDSFHEFTTNFQKDSSVLVRTMNSIAKLAFDTMTYQVGKWKADISAIITTAAPKSLIKDAPGLVGSTGNIGSDIVSDWKKIAQTVMGFFTGSGMGKAPRVPGEAFTGDIPGKDKKGKDGSAAAAENALKNFEESLKNWLATFQSRVDDAKAHLDRKSEQLADFDVVHPANQPMSAQDQATRQGLVNQQLQAEQALRERLLQQQQAEKQAANEYLQVAAAISTHLKNHDQLIRQARDGAREHAKAAQDVYLAYLRAGTELDSMIAKEREAANLRIDNARDAQNATDEYNLTGKNLQRDISGESLGQQLAVDKARGKNVKPQDEDRVKIALDQLAVAAAADTEALKQNELARARAAYDQTKSIDDYNKLRDAQNALLQATLGVTRAEDQRAADQAKAQSDQDAQWQQFINGLIQKVNAPGLQGNAQAGFTFDPLALLMDALEKTQMFADVMNTVTSIVNTFALALNAFRPVIDVLLQIVRAVANVFIFMYNAIARILDLFGMQIQQLQYLTSAMSGLVPLLEIWHEIPTLNELAAGKLNSPLSTTPTGNDSLGQSNGGQNTLMRIVEVLVGIMAAIIVEKVISGMSLTQAVQQTVHLLGINMGQKVASAQAVADAARSVGVTISTAAKQAALGIQANVFLAQANVTLTAILAALEVKNVLSIFSDAASGGATAGAAGVGAGVAGAAGVGVGSAGSAGAALKGLSDGVKAAASSLMSHTAALRQNAAAFSNLTATMMQFGMSVTNAANYLRELQSETGSANLATALSLQTSRVSASGGYGINRAPAY